MPKTPEYIDTMPAMGVRRQGEPSTLRTRAPLLGLWENGRTTGAPRGAGRRTWCLAAAAPELHEDVTELTSPCRRAARQGSHVRGGVAYSSRLAMTARKMIFTHVVCTPSKRTRTRMRQAVASTGSTARWGDGLCASTRTPLLRVGVGSQRTERLAGVHAHATTPRGDGEPNSRIDVSR